MEKNQDDKQSCLAAIFQKLRKCLNEENRPDLVTFVQDIENNNFNSGSSDQQNLIRKFLEDLVERNIKLQRVHYETLVQNYESLGGKIRDWNLYRNQVNVDLDHHQKTLDEIKVLNQDLIGIHSTEMKSLLTKMATARFSRRPKGPIGSSISVVGDWKPVVEYILRPVLFTFLVHNQEDRKLLEELIDSISGWPTDYSKQPSVWVTTFDAPRLEVESCSTHDPTLVTLMDAVRVRAVDKIVTRFLVDYTNLHRILLFKTQHEAFPILSEKNNIPRGCLMAYTLDFFKVSPHPSFESVQLDEEELNFDVPAYPYSKPPSSGLTQNKLRVYQKSGLELERLLRSMKDMQLELLTKVLQHKNEFACLQRGLGYFKNLSWKELEFGLDLLVKDNSMEGVGEIFAARD